MIRVLHIDENSADRARLIKIAPTDSFTIIGSHGSIEEAVSAGNGELASADIVVLGTVAGSSIEDSITTLKGLAPVKPVVVLIDRFSLDSLGAAFEAGAMGYLIKSISAGSAVRIDHAGDPRARRSFPPNWPTCWSKRRRMHSTPALRNAGGR